MIQWHKLKHAKGLPRIMLQMAKATIAQAQERKVRAQVYARDRRRCFFPGCRRAATELHHIEPSSLRGRRVWQTEDLLSACRQHHAFFKSGLIRVTGNPDRKTLKVHVTTLGRQAGLRIPKVA